MRILFLSRWFPFPPNNGSKNRIYNILKGISKEHEVYLVSFCDRQEKVSTVHPFCRQIKVLPYREFSPNSLRAVAGFFQSTPRYLLDTYSSPMERLIRETIEQSNIDLVIASETHMASYIGCLRELPAMIDELELGTFYQKTKISGSTTQRFRNQLTWIKLRNYLSQLLQQFRACTIVSNVEYELLKQMAPQYKNAHIIPNCVDLDHYQNVTPNPRSNSMIFCGPFHYSANYEAMKWFLREVFPIVRSKAPDSHLLITGNTAGFPLPSTENLTLTGYVEDVRPLIAGSTISLVPILSGGGTRIKILEAMALKTPVIATSKGAEGLDVQDGENILLADTPKEFSEAILQLMDNRALRERIAQNAYQLVQEKYNWQRVIPKLLNLIESVSYSEHDRA